MVGCGGKGRALWQKNSRVWFPVPGAPSLIVSSSDLHCLPWSMSVSERRGPGTVLQSFSLNCSSHVPTLKLLHVWPPTTFFNTLSLSVTTWQGVYMGKVGSWAWLGTGNKGRP